MSIYNWNEALNKMRIEDNSIIDVKKREGICRILKDIDKSVTSYELFIDGEIIDDSGEYDQYYSDSPGGCYHRLRIVKHNGKFYVYKEKITVERDMSEKSECIAFYELK